MELLYRADYRYVTFLLAKSNQNSRQIRRLCQTVICPAPRPLKGGPLNVQNLSFDPQ